MSASDRGTFERDRGSTLVLLLVIIVISALIVIPIMSYSVTVFRAQHVQVDKARATQLSRGGVWVALSRQAGLYTDCGDTVGGTASVDSHLAGVTVGCTVLQKRTLREPEQVPYALAVLQADVGNGTSATIPNALVATPGPGGTVTQYVNPNTVSDPGTWRASDADGPDWTYLAQAGKVWIPELPVQATDGGDTRDTTMAPGTAAIGYSTCRVFFPGTFTTPIEISQPAYFTSGVYYFTQPITLKPGADVVAGGGSETGCTTDFEAVSNANYTPEPLNMSGIGATFILGGNARLIIDDSGGSTSNIRLAMNQRYVADTEQSVAASSSVAIMSVNGNHAPFSAAEVDLATSPDLRVPGVVDVPQSRVDDPIDNPHNPADDPLASAKQYAPSTHTPKPGPPAAPTGVVTQAHRYPTFNSDGSYPTSGSTYQGAVTVTWTPPTASANNGAVITKWRVEKVGDATKWCEPAAPPDVNGDGLPDGVFQPTCTVAGLADGAHQFVVTATNAYGTTSSSQATATVTLSGSGASPTLTAPTVAGASISNLYSDGLDVAWTGASAASSTVAPVTGYAVTATPVVAGPAVVTCTARWDQTTCRLPVGTSSGLVTGVDYDLTIRARQEIGGTRVGTPFTIDGVPTETTPPEPDKLHLTTPLPTTPAPALPVAPPTTATVRVPEPIIDLRASSTSNRVKVRIAGYVAIPQGHLRIEAPTTSADGDSVELLGGLVAAQVRMAAGAEPETLRVVFDNPIAQKRVSLRSEATSGGMTVTSTAVVQVNRSGSIAVNSWLIQ